MNEAASILDDAATNEEADGRTKRGFEWWADHHEESELLHRVLQEFAKRRNAGGKNAKSIEWFHREVLRPRFKCALGVNCVRTYIKELQRDLA